MIISKQTIINVFNEHRIRVNNDINAASKAVSLELGQDEATILSVVLESLSVREPNYN